MNRINEIFFKANEMENKQYNMFYQGKYNKYNELYIIFKFMFDISEQIEIKNKKKLILVKFPRRPETFMLSDVLLNNYFSECNIVDSNKKMTDLMRMYKVRSFIQLTIGVQSVYGE